MLFRYCILTAVLGLSLYGVLVAAHTSHLIIAPTAGIAPEGASTLWTFAMLAAAMSLSLCLLTVHGLSAAMADWYVGHRGLFNAASFGSALCIVFYWL